MNFLYPLTLDKINNGYSTAVVLKNGSINYVALSKYKTLRIFTPLDKISDKIKKYFIQYEDKYFYYHLYGRNL